MGCDIHTFVEWTTSPENDDRLYWQGFASHGGSRDYIMFGLLADVRGSGCIYAPRGLPDHLGWEADRYFHMMVNDVHAGNGVQGWCTTEQAEGWVAAGWSQWVNAERTKITDPDIHSCSWLTPDELAVVLSTYMTDHSGDYHYSVEWDAMLAAMRRFEEMGARARVVFGFDN